MVVTLAERVSDGAFGGPVAYPAGSRGTIVSVQQGDGYSVKFCDDQGRTLALVDYTGEELLAMPTADEASQRFVNSADWRFAKTMAHYNPHWYVVERDAGGEAFSAFVEFVRTGPVRRYRGGRYLCVTVGEWDYWLTHAGPDGWIINRKRTCEAGWDSFPPPSYNSAELIWHDVERELLTREQAEKLLTELTPEPR